MKGAFRRVCLGDLAESARAVTVLSIIHDRLDALLHPSSRHDAVTRARHHAFMAPRLLGSLGAFAAFPAYLVIRGAPTAFEVAVFAWLMAPILLTWFLSRTGRYEGAHVLSSLALAGFVMILALSTGEFVAAIWLVVLPLEAALSASRRVMAFASALALSCAALLIVLGNFGILPSPDANPLVAGRMMELAVASAILYAAGLALAAETLARTTLALLNGEEDRYRLLARNMSDVISCHRRDGAVQFISAAVETLLGTQVSLLLGHGLFDRVHVADRPAYLTALSDAARGGEARSVEFRLRRDTPNERQQTRFIWVEMRCKPLEQAGLSTGSSPAEVVAVMRDITDRKIQEQALEVARSASEQADAAKTRFLATMSHELRTPLNAIIGFSEMIAQEEVLMLDGARRKEYAQLINDSGQHLLSVVNGILDMSKMEAGNFEICPEPFDPRAALINCCSLLALKASENGIELVTRVSEDVSLMNGDPRAFKQVALNLVSNAIKFTERGGKVTVSAVVEGSRLVLRVSDTGVGIAPEDLKRIGDPFFQAGKTYERRHEGTGLGLSIVKRLVALHGGDLTLRSKIDHGTTVTVALPIAFASILPKIEPERSSNIATLSARSPGQSQPDQVKRSA
jgi:two-component system, cell cycle sensor histidine kinase DivJ